MIGLQELALWSQVATVLIVVISSIWGLAKGKIQAILRTPERVQHLEEKIDHLDRNVDSMTESQRKVEDAMIALTHGDVDPEQVAEEFEYHGPERFLEDSEDFYSDGRRRRDE